LDTDGPSLNSNVEPTLLVGDRLLLERERTLSAIAVTDHFGRPRDWQIKWLMAA